MRSGPRYTLLGAALFLLLPLSFFACTGCTGPRLSVHRPPAVPLDVIIIPGCPSLPDGSLSPCQRRRAVFGALLWERGFTRSFITSGAAVYTPYIEAEALAAALHALGVPAANIYLEPDALHTDENMLRALVIARRFSLRTVAVASDGLQAGGACQILRGLDQPCSAIPIDYGLTRTREQAAESSLAPVRTPRVAFQPLAQREAAIAARTGRRRWPSALLYLSLGVRRLLGVRYQPVLLPPSPPRTYAELPR